MFSSSSLFTVNSSHAFVHVQPSSKDFDPVTILLNTLAKPAINTQWGKVTQACKFKHQSWDIHAANLSLTELADQALLRYKN